MRKTSKATVAKSVDEYLATLPERENEEKNALKQLVNLKK